METLTGHANHPNLPGCWMEEQRGQDQFLYWLSSALQFELPGMHISSTWCRWPPAAHVPALWRRWPLESHHPHPVPPPLLCHPPALAPPPARPAGRAGTAAHAPSRWSHHSTARGGSCAAAVSATPVVVGQRSYEGVRTRKRHRLNKNNRF